MRGRICSRVVLSAPRSYRFCIRKGESLPESINIVSGVWLGGNADALQKGFDEGTFSPRQCRFFLGYSGWGRDQLATEFDMNSWLRTGADVELIFRTSPDVMWSRTIRRLSESNPIYTHFPDYSSSN